MLDQATALETRVVEIGGVAIALRTGSLAFARMVEERYAGFVTDGGEGNSGIRFDIELRESAAGVGESCEMEDAELEGLAEDDLSVRYEGGVWWMERGDFVAQWDPRSGRGRIRQAANPYSLDSIIRIVHSLVLAERGEFLVHAASAIRNGCAFLFAGVSGAGKTTISRLAPADAILLTDEISYVRKAEGASGASSAATPHYDAHGTPFAGELARVGEHCSAPLRALYLLQQGPENRVGEVPRAAAIQALLRNILFFAHDAELVQRVFEGACEFVDSVPVRTLTFRPEAAVWDLIG